PSVVVKAFSMRLFSQRIGYARTTRLRGELMAATLTATFEIDNWDENPALATEAGSNVSRADVLRSFDGDLEGDAAVVWLMAYGEDGSAMFVGLERFVGTVDGNMWPLVRML